MKRHLRELSNRFAQSGFSKEAAHDRAQAVLMDAMGLDTLVQNGQLSSAQALKSAEAMLRCAMDMEPPTTGGANSSHDQPVTALPPALVQARRVRYVGCSCESKLFVR